MSQFSCLFQSGTLALTSRQLKLKHFLGAKGDEVQDVVKALIENMASWTSIEDFL